MDMGPIARMLAGGRRLHVQHGPIDLVIGADGSDEGVHHAYSEAVRQFNGLLETLSSELKLLRSPARPAGEEPTGPVARRMYSAVVPYASEMFITPMAAVAGSVADEIMAAMLAVDGLRRAYVNNGGDIALHLAPGEVFRVGLVKRPDQPEFYATASIDAGSGVGGIATSGYPGRSFSFGIAEAVTVLAPTAAMADAAATVIANAVDLPGHRSVHRVPANSVQTDTDLEDRLVTRDVGQLTELEIEAALGAGLLVARRLKNRGLVIAAALYLQGVSKTLETPIIQHEGNAG